MLQKFRLEMAGMSWPESKVRYDESSLWIDDAFQVRIQIRNVFDVLGIGR